LSPPKKRARAWGRQEKKKDPAGDAYIGCRGTTTETWEKKNRPVTDQGRGGANNVTWGEGIGSGQTV